MRWMCGLCRTLVEAMLPWAVVSDCDIQQTVDCEQLRTSTMSVCAVQLVSGLGRNDVHSAHCALPEAPLWESLWDKTTGLSLVELISSQLTTPVWTRPPSYLHTYEPITWVIQPGEHGPFI